MISLTDKVERLAKEPTLVISRTENVYLTTTLPLEDVIYTAQQTDLTSAPAEDLAYHAEYTDTDITTAEIEVTDDNMFIYTATILEGPGISTVIANGNFEEVIDAAYNYFYN